MAYQKRDVQNLLTNPELDLFQASRMNAVRSLSPKQLEAKIKRSRTLRDKYRDLFRRQSVSTQAQSGTKRKALGGENSRTELKSDVFQEILSRFEDQLLKHQSSESDAKVGNASSRPTARRSGAAGQKGRGAIVTAGTKAASPRQLARANKAAEDEAHKVVRKRAVKAESTKPVASQKTSAKRPKTKAVTELVKAVRKAVVTKQKDGGDAARESLPRSSKRKQVLGDSVTKLSQGAVPSSMPAAAARSNPLKDEPVNRKIHASARARTRAVQAKSDSR
ncbi:hypothetical protein [Ottowia thiooxydans]|uniref:ProQ/FinO domain-containing protein n=1 Tax=Ottowia thiooxydans TaxID=219182 RepID=A0ABV2Q1R0_9BURK